MKEELLQKLMSSENEEGDTDEMKRRAKMECLKELLSLITDSAGDGIKEGMQKLTVMAPDQESLMEGIEKAKDVVQGAPNMIEELKKKRKA
jgi:hypothetical protein